MSISIENKKLIKKWCIASSIFIMLIGTLSHFTYDFFNQNKFIGFLCPVSESVFEHLKLAFYPLILFSFIDYFPLRKKVNNYFFGKAIGIILCNLFIVIAFYTYTFFSKHPILFIDISLFFIGCIFSQVITYKLFIREVPIKNSDFYGILLFLIQILLFTVFTFNPPKNINIFVSPETSCETKYIDRTF